MSIKSRQLGQTKIAPVAAALTITTGANTLGVSAPVSQTVGLLQGFKLTEWVSTGEVWRPLGINVIATTTFTVVAPIFTLQKAPLSLLGGNTYVSAATGGVATGGPAPAGLLVAPGTFYYPFSAGTATSTNVAPYTFAAADAAGDCWRVTLSTGVTAGVATILLHYVNYEVAGISDAVTTL
jgi:hypothetical protein